MKTKKLIGIIAILAILSVIAYALFTTCNKKDEVQAYAHEVIPVAPDYTDSTMWYIAENDTDGTGADVFYIVSTWELDWQTADGQICHYADVQNEQHRNNMAKEISAIADYMGIGNNFYSPYYRHISFESWVTRNEDTIRRRAHIAMGDVKKAFDHFQAKRDATRPFIIAGFSQGGMAVVEVLKYMDDETYKKLVAAYVLGYKVTPDDTLQTTHIRAAQDSSDLGVTICYNSVKDVKYIQPIISGDCCMCINPVNWKTDDTPATLHDSITVTLSPEHKVLVLSNYVGAEYKPVMNFINVGDVHSGEPWLYKECLQRNIQLRTNMWRMHNN